MKKTYANIKSRKYLVIIDDKKYNLDIHENSSKAAMNRNMYK